MELKFVLQILSSSSVVLLFTLIGATGLFKVFHSHEKSNIHNALRAISIGVLIIGIAFGLWHYFVNIARYIPAFPISDVLFVIAPFFLIHGLYFIHQIFFRYTPLFYKFMLFFAIFVTLLAVSVLFNVQLILNLKISSIIQAYFIFTDVIMVSMSLFIYGGAGGHMAGSIKYILASLLIFSVADIAAIVGGNMGLFVVSKVADVLFITGALLLGIGMTRALRKFTTYDEHHGQSHQAT